MNKDTLFLTIFFDNNWCDLGSYRDSFEFVNDMLNMVLIDTNRVETFILYDSINKRHDTVYKIKLPVMHQLIGGYDFRKFKYIFTGFKEISKGFKFNNDNLCACTSKPIKYEIYTRMILLI
jgi:hypothetical protein